MTIRKGEPWGAPRQDTSQLPIATSDRELAALYSRFPGTGPVAVRLAGGDLFRTMGGHESAESEGAMEFPVDMGTVEIDGERIWFAAHVVVRSLTGRSGWVAMNAQWRGELNLAPKGHPNDGRLDVLSWDLSGRQLALALSKAKRGDHLPHPEIKSERTTAATTSGGGGRRVSVDGAPWRRFRTLAVSIEADAMVVVV